MRAFFFQSERTVILSYDRKLFYSFLNKKMKRSAGVSRLQWPNGGITTNPADIADILGSEFVKNYSYAQPVPGAHFPSRLVAECEAIFDLPFVLAILRSSSNSAAGPDLLPGVFYRSLAVDLARAFVIIFQQSFFAGRMPDPWQLARVVPVFKRGVKEVAANYRPVSLTCVARKLFERVQSNAMYKHLNCENLLNSSQHGFRSKCSTTSALLHSNFKYVSYLDKRADVDVILFDFSKAIDVVNHHLLLLKLKAYGFGKFTCAWITDFLTDTQQYVCIGPSVSLPVSVPSGVIQASVSGPLLFIIYVNDLLDVVMSSDTFLYAMT
jgi:hypothetical protein